MLYSMDAMDYIVDGMMVGFAVILVLSLVMIKMLEKQTTKSLAK